MFELLCGRKSIIPDESHKYLAPAVILHYRDEKLNEIIYWGLQKQIDPQSLNVFAEMAYACLAEERSQRPNIDEIVTGLENALELARANKPVRPFSSLLSFYHIISVCFYLSLYPLLSIVENVSNNSIIRLTWSLNSLKEG